MLQSTNDGVGFGPAGGANVSRRRKKEEQEEEEEEEEDALSGVGCSISTAPPPPPPPPPPVRSISLSLLHCFLAVGEGGRRSEEETQLPHLTDISSTRQPRRKLEVSPAAAREKNIYI